MLYTTGTIVWTVLDFLLSSQGLSIYLRIFLRIETHKKECLIHSWAAPAGWNMYRTWNPPDTKPQRGDRWKNKTS